MVKCLYCEKELTGKATKYCNGICQQAFQWKQKKDLVLADTVNLLPYENVGRIVRRTLKEEYGNKCMRCNWAEINPYTNKVPIELEHKDGNSDNWKLDNLELLCPNCHSLTKTYKGANRGNGRYARRQKYKEGKSF